jgi:hypothetical protein
MPNKEHAMPKRSNLQAAAPRRLATIADASEYVLVDPKTIRRWISGGQLTGFRAGPKLLRVDLNEIDRMLEGPLQHRRRTSAS